MQPEQSFAGRLKCLREERGLSGGALAAKIGVSKVTVWKWEKGDTTPRPLALNALAKALDVSVAELQQPGAAAAADAAAESPESGAETLAETMAEAKRKIAGVAGIDPSAITISIDY